MKKKPVTIYVLLFTYSILLYGGIRGIGVLVANNPDFLWAAIIVLVSVTMGIVSLFFRKKWPYIYNIVLLSLILAFQIPLLVNNLASGKTGASGILIMAGVMAAFTALLLFFILNAGKYFLEPSKKGPEQKI